MAAAAILLATPIDIVVVVVGGFLFGLSIGGTLVHVNSGLGLGPRGGVRLVRANLSSVIGGLVAPLAMAAAARTVGWSAGALIPIPFLAVLMVTLPGSPARDAGREQSHRPSPGLPRAYWRSWWFLTLTIAVEFSFVAWGSQVASARAGLGTADATALASLYVAGMVIGRFVLAVNPALTARRVPILRVGTAIVAMGAIALAMADNAAIAAAGLLLGGLGLSPAYPLGASLALAHAPGSPVAASARLTAASGVAIFSAPLTLGIVAGSHGVVTAWLLVIALLALAMLVAFHIPSPPGEAPSAPMAPL